MSALSSNALPPDSHNLMPATFNKPFGLVFGNDPKLMNRLEEKFGASIHFKTAKLSACGFTQDVISARVAIVLWSHQADALAHRIQNECPSMPVLVERNRSGFRSPSEGNGFTAIFDKADGREKIVRELESIMIKREKPASALQIPWKDATLNLESFLIHLPQVAAFLEDESRLADTLLTAVLGAIRGTQGGLFLMDHKFRKFNLVAARNLPASFNQMQIDVHSDFGIWLSKTEGGIITDSIGSPANPIWKGTGCNLILPLLSGDDAIGWLLLKTSGRLTGALTDLLQTMVFFIAEAIKQSRRAISLNKECKRWQEICSKMTEAAFWIDEDDNLKVLKEGVGLLKTKSPFEPRNLSDLRSTRLKSAVQRVRLHDAPTQAFADGPGMVAQADSLNSGGVLLTLVRSQEERSEYRTQGWRQAVLLFVCESRISDHPARELLASVRELVLRLNPSGVSINWIRETVESRSKIRLAFSRITEDDLMLQVLSTGCAARILLVIADVIQHITQSVDQLVLARNPKKELTLDFPVIMPECCTGRDSLSELALLDSRSVGMKREKAAFGFRLTFNEKTDLEVSKGKWLAHKSLEPSGDFVLQKPVESSTNSAHGTREGSTIKSPYY